MTREELYALFGLEIRLGIWGKEWAVIIDDSCWQGHEDDQDFRPAVKP